MKSQELRQAWIDFFVSKQHKLMPSASLIPDEMSTTLFTIAGMEQFVPVFLGDEPPAAPRVVTVQRCLRVAGAKSDIENVGRTGRHGTFLEMLGNFSFGDYYKREAIEYAWEFVTKILKLDPARLYVTVHTDDDEAASVWQNDVGLEPTRITRFEQDNFWTMGSTGPCGPCTEIFYDTGAEYASGPDDTGPNLGDRYVEIWNVVFQQYNRGADGVLTELPKKAIDTGAGLERMLAVCNGHASMYETDLFTDLIEVQPPVGAASMSAKDRRERQNIIADHARAVTFLINDGIFPSNTDRGYVLRFLIRRAIRNGRLLGYPNGFLTELVPAVVRSLAPGYPELRENVTRIQQTLRQEEQTFDRTLERGTAMLDELIVAAKRDASRLISGADAFMLHDTYGFPIELTREIAGDEGVKVDGVAFEAAMHEQRERARRDAKSKRAVLSLAELPAIRSEFTGYAGLDGEGEIVAMLQEQIPVQTLAVGQHGVVILDRSSFYAERGGQIGDRGRLTLEDGSVFEVDDTQYMGEAIAHHGVVKSGEFVVGERAQTLVHDWWRREIRRHHTSAHLLQRALKDVLGEDVTQAGSWVGIDRMRFDFRNPGGALSPEQKRAVAARVNEMIRDDSPVITRELPIEEARQSGAIWMFGEKYGETVRVLQAGPSIEFCGGTHAHSTGELGMFLILNEFSIGSGIRRIESCVSLSAERFVTSQQDLVGELASTLATTPEELTDRVTKLQREMRDLQTAVGQMKTRLAHYEAQSYLDRAERSGDRTFVGAVVPEANVDAIRHLSSALRSRLSSGVIALAGIDNGTVSLLVSASDDLVKGGVHAGNLIKLAAPLIDGKGGGAATQAQGGGKNAAGAPAALQAIRDAVLSVPNQA
jgi:alanyl-tRNA synthetase